MAGRQPALAVNAFLTVLQHALSCVTHLPLLASGRDAGGPHAVAFPLQQPSPDRPALPMLQLPGSRDWYLLIGMQYEVVRAQGERGPWQVRMLSYRYHLSNPREREILGYHWHPQTYNRVRRPHLHLWEHGTPVDLREVHLPTPRIALDAVLRFAIEELHTEPLRPDWEQVLAETEEAFRSWRGCG